MIDRLILEYQNGEYRKDFYKYTKELLEVVDNLVNINDTLLERYARMCDRGVNSVTISLFRDTYRSLYAEEKFIFSRYLGLLNDGNSKTEDITRGLLVPHNHTAYKNSRKEIFALIRINGILEVLYLLKCLYSINEFHRGQ